MNISITHDLEYLAIFSLVLILPKVLLRFKIPSGISALILGLLLIQIDPSLKSDQLFRFLSQVGITSLFLFAGLEVDLNELKEDRKYLTGYLLKSAGTLVLIAATFSYFVKVPFQDSLLLSLGIFTPSAGFILTSMHSHNVSQDQEYWIKSKAISKEVVAIILLFFALQSGDFKTLIVNSIFFICLFLALPFIFKFFFKYISPYAPNSEVPFLVALSLIAGVLSKEMGAYYLVGAFAVGLIASRFKKDIFKDSEHTFFVSIASFFNVFLPFYFFKAGLGINIFDIELKGLYLGLALIIVFVPIRLLLIRSSLKHVIKNLSKFNYTISLSLMPTLIFGLVMTNILLERGVVKSYIIYSLLIYTIITSLLPSIIFSIQLYKKKSQ